MTNIAGLVSSNKPFKNYELVILSLMENGKPQFQSDLHFSRFPLAKEEDVLRELKLNKIDKVAIDSKINSEKFQQELTIEMKIMETEDCYLSIDFISNVNQIKKESDLWRVQMQDKIRNLVRGIDGPCDGVYESDTIDAFVLALSLL